MSTLNVATIQSISTAPPVFKNSSGTEKGQLCKVWINFNQQGTLSERSSFGVSSISDQGTGRTRINFSTNFSSCHISKSCKTLNEFNLSNELIIHWGTLIVEDHPVGISIADI